MAKKQGLPAASAEAASIDSTSNALSPDDNVTIPRISLKETGFVGLKVSSGQILQESNRAFQYPAFIKTVNEMRNNPTVGAAMNVYRGMLTRPEWFVQPQVNATEVQKERAKFVETVMHDMSDSWETFIHSVVPYLEYGYMIHNIVPYRRLRRNGSKHNDGLVGIRKLAIRNPETIAKWVFTEDGSELVKVEQSIAHLQDAYKFQSQLNDNGLVDIPRDKFLLFTASATAGNPQGNSIYKNIYLAFKQLTLLQDQQLLSIAKDVQGIMCIEVPAEYLAGENSPDKGAAAEAFKKIIDGYNAGTNRGLLVPQKIDSESKLPLFKYSLMESKGGSKNNVESIITGLQNDIAQALSVDVLRLGADGTGSFSLASQKSSILALAIDSRLKEIRGVLNQHLMRFIHESNGWSTEDMPTFEYKDVEDIDLADFSAAVQRIFATSAVEMDRPIFNRVRRALGVPELPEDMPIQIDKLPATITGQQTNSGEGMKSGAGDGTRKNAISGAGDSSVANKENTA